MVSSVVGFYSSPLFTRLLPERQDTPLTKVGAAGWGWGAPGLPWGCKTPFPTVCPLCVPMHYVVSPHGRTVSHCRAGPQWFSGTWKAPSPAWGLPAAALPPPKPPPSPQIIGNCVSLLVLSSALPVFSRTLGEPPRGIRVMPGWGCPQDWGALTSVPHPCAGITRFDLLGDFGRFNWLGNFYIVFLYNMGFAGLTTLCLVKKVSWAVQAELIRAFGEDRDTGMAAGVSPVPHPGSHTLPVSRSAQAAAACDALPDPQQALLGLGDWDVSSPPPRGGPRVAVSHRAGPDSTWRLRDIRTPQGELRPHGGADNPSQPLVKPCLGWGTGTCPPHCGGPQSGCQPQS